MEGGIFAVALLLVLITMGGAFLINVLPILIKLATFLACVAALVAIVWGLFSTGNGFLGMIVVGFFIVSLKAAIGG